MYAIFCKLKNMSSKCFFSTVIRCILRVIYKFDSWHISGSFYCRQYKRDIVKEVNNLEGLDNYSCVVEIGCGLGDLVSRINVQRKFGYDIDKNSIKAARVLYKKTHFFLGSFDEVKNSIEQNISILILVNWIHNIPKDELMWDINNLVNDKKVAYIILDEVLPSVSGYKYYHDFSNCFQGYKTLKIFLDPEGIRNFRILYKV